VDIKERQMVAETAAKADTHALKEEELSAKMQLEGLKTGSKIKTDEARLNAEQERAGVQMGIDIAKGRAEQARNVGKPK
jgi:hypothetical protein